VSAKNDAGYWTSIRAGDYLNLTDYQSFASGGTAGVDYRVSGVRRIGITDADSGRVVAEYHFHDLEQSDRSVQSFVIAKAGDEFELRLYFVPDGFIAGTRDELIDHGHTWFFLPPTDPEDFVSSDLEYAPFPDVPPIEEDGKSRRCEFGFSGFGHSVFGSYRQSADEVPVIVTEYATEEDVMNPLLLILEERWVRADGSRPEEGGFVTPMLGCRVQPESAEIFPG